MSVVPIKSGHQCPDCDRTFDSPQGLGAHRFKKHGYTNPRKVKKPGATVDVPVRSYRRRLNDTERLAIAVRALWPHAIRTDDAESLLASLALIDAMREVVDNG